MHPGGRGRARNYRKISPLDHIFSLDTFSLFGALFSLQVATVFCRASCPCPCEQRYCTYRVVSNGARRGEPTKTKRSDSMASKQRLQLASKTTQRNERWKDRQARTVGKKKGDIRACCSRTTANVLGRKKIQMKKTKVRERASRGSWKLEFPPEDGKPKGGRGG